jgi:hypothetical protein
MIGDRPRFLRIRALPFSTAPLVLHRASFSTRATNSRKPAAVAAGVRVARGGLCWRWQDDIDLGKTPRLLDVLAAADDVVRKRDA